MPLIIITIISLLVGLINPYGLDAIKYLFNSFGVSTINDVVGEMNPATVTALSGIYVYAVSALYFLSFYINKGNNKLRFFLLCSGIVYLSLSHIRGLWILLVLFPLIMGYNCQNKMNNSEIKISSNEKKVYYILIVIILLLVGFGAKLNENVSLVEFADYLDKNASSNIKLYTNYNDGGYMEYRGYKCYIDSRAEVFLKSNNAKEDIFDEYHNLIYGMINAKEFLEKYQFDFILVRDTEGFLLRELRNDINYEEVLSKTTNQKEGIKHYLFKNNNYVQE